MVSRLKVIAVEPDAVTRRLLALYLEPRQVVLHLLEFSADLAKLPSVPPADLVLINRNLLEVQKPQHLRELWKRCKGIPIYALADPPANGQAEPAAFPIAGEIVKPVKPAAVLSALGLEHGLMAGEGAPTGDAVTEGSGVSSPSGAAGSLQGFLNLINQMEMNREMIDDLATSFISRGEEYLAGMESALATGALEEVGRLSHAMKGMSGNLRFDALVEMNERMILASKNGDLETGTLILPQMKQEFEQLRQGIRERWAKA